METGMSKRLLPLFYHDDMEVCLSVVKALYVKIYTPSIKPLFHNLGFVVTGRVETSKENLSEWFKGDATDVRPGGKLITTVTKEVSNPIQSFKKTALYE